MNMVIRVPLDLSRQQRERLCALRSVFSGACNELAGAVQQSGIWSRVALHHLHYRRLREQFPLLGSQMTCNAIYAVSRMARLVYESPGSPYRSRRPGNEALPRIRFAENSPVHFDRHTLSLVGSRLSLFTLDGRMHLDLASDSARPQVLVRARLSEIVLVERRAGMFELLFVIARPADGPLPGAGPRGSRGAVHAADRTPPAMPPYLTVEEFE